MTPPVAIEHIPAAQDNSPAPVAVIEPAPAAPVSPPTESSDVTAAPLFRQRTDIPKDAARAAPAGIPAVIPIVRAPTIPASTRTGGRRIHGTGQFRAEPGRRLARLPVALGRLIETPRLRFSCKIVGRPISGAGVFESLSERAWSAAIAQLVEHVIRNDGVTG